MVQQQSSASNLNDCGPIVTFVVGRVRTFAGHMVLPWLDATSTSERG
jgi:hypothetical protein